jgi:phage gp36-like protein
MAYCTLDDITKALEEATVIQLTDDESLKPVAIDPADPDHAAIIARVDEAIETADAEIDGYCAVKYAVPLAPVPAVVSKLSVELAVYYLYSRRSVPEKIEKRYDKAVARLRTSRGGFSPWASNRSPPHRPPPTAQRRTRPQTTGSSPATL